MSFCSLDVIQFSFRELKAMNNFVAVSSVWEVFMTNINEKH